MKTTSRRTALFDNLRMSLQHTNGLHRNSARFQLIRPRQATGTEPLVRYRESFVSCTSFSIGNFMYYYYCRSGMYLNVFHYSTDILTTNTIKRKDRLKITNLNQILKFVNFFLLQFMWDIYFIRNQVEHFMRH